MSTELKHWLMGAAVGCAFGILVGSQISFSVVTSIMRKQAISHGHAIYNPTNGVFQWKERESERFILHNNRLEFTTNSVHGIDSKDFTVDFSKRDREKLAQSYFHLGVSIAQAALDITNITNNTKGWRMPQPRDLHLWCVQMEQDLCFWKRESSLLDTNMPHIYTIERSRFHE